MKTRLLFAIVVLLLAGMACADETAVEPAGQTAGDIPDIELSAVLDNSAFKEGDTAFGFFPSPPEATFESILQHFQDLGEHADFILIQPNIPWEDFVVGIEGESQAREDLRNQMILANQNELEAIFVVDPLNGLNRREFFGLPASWEASFSNPEVRMAFTNFALWILQEFEPRYLGLASEINTYMDAHPEEVDHYTSLYRDTYQQVKEVSPETQVFVTFQWDDLNNLFPTSSEGRSRFDINWEQIDVYEPELDLWVISSYPYFIFNGGEPIPMDYYTPLLGRTDKPLAVAEGGFSSRPVGPIQADEQDQEAYLESIHDQLGERLEFWVYIILNDLNMDSIGDEMEQRGRPLDDIETLSMFASVGLRQADGTPKPALELWDSYRSADGIKR